MDMNLFTRTFLKHFKPMRYAKKMGVTIGENCRIISSPDWGSEP